MSSDGTVRMVRAGNRAPREYETTAVLTLRISMRGSTTPLQLAGRILGLAAQHVSDAELHSASVKPSWRHAPVYTVKVECTGLPSQLAAFDRVLRDTFGR